MSYWDTSALVPVVVAEPRTAEMRALAAEALDPATSWLTLVECSSAVARLEREGQLTQARADQALTEVRAVLRDFEELRMTEALRTLAGQLLRRHPLRTGDALHLAAALVWAENEPEGRGFICLDDRLREAAAREGFRVLPAD
ncbi:MAG: type II toxin-antitoxin system VapC family toxin [Armatimonadetes bacterium]|nr:type II toxin-antitoxin system VapC family toxin [Armatimonadota bacterium]